MTMPTFLVVGAMKSGTTALSQYLDQHPDVFMSPVKEPNFFAFEGEELQFQAPCDASGINRTSVTSFIEYQALFSDARPDQARGEASHWYLYSERAPHRIRELVPEAKIIAVLRNPVERAYSEFLHGRRMGHEPLESFAQALAAEDRRVIQEWAMGHYTRRGFYHAQLLRYYNLFDPDQIKVFLYEDLKDASAVLSEIFGFIGVDPSYRPDVSIKPNVGGIPQSVALHRFLATPNPVRAVLKPVLPDRLRRLAVEVKNRNLKKPEMPRGIRESLVELYQRDVLALQELLGRDLSGWLE